jgi:hypothetical protein
MNQALTEIDAFVQAWPTIRRGLAPLAQGGTITSDVAKGHHGTLINLATTALRIAAALIFHA